MNQLNDVLQEFVQGENGRADQGSSSSSDHEMKDETEKPVKNGTNGYTSSSASNGDDKEKNGNDHDDESNDVDESNVNGNSMSTKKTKTASKRKGKESKKVQFCVDIYFIYNWVTSFHILQDNHNDGVTNSLGMRISQSLLIV